MGYAADELGRVPGSAALRRGRVLRARAPGASPFATATGLSPPIRVTPASLMRCGVKSCSFPQPSFFVGRYFIVPP
jgi:hypothetical protein